MNGLLRRLTRIRRDERGAAALEFAIVASAFIISSLGIIEFSRTLQVRNQLAYAIDHGARMVLMETAGNKVQNSEIAERIRENFHSYDKSKLDIPAPTESTVNGVTMVDIVARYPLEIFIPGFAGTMTIELQRSFPRS